MAPSSLPWRCSITHAANMTPDGLPIAAGTTVDSVAPDSTASGDRIFKWPDAPGRSARERAVMFLERSPIIGRDGFGRDWPYAGSLTEMLGRAELDHPTGFPYSSPTPPWIS